MWGYNSNGFTTNITSVTTEDEINIYPNPTNGQFTIDLNTLNANSSIIVYNTNGQKLMTQNVTSEKVIVDLEDQLTGIYLIQIHDGISYILKRVVKL